MKIEARASVQQMRPYQPPTGGRHGKLRLDFNEHVAGLPDYWAQLIRESMTPELLATYPDYSATRTELAAYFEVDDAHFALTNGTDEAIQLLIQTFVEHGDRVGLLTPSYAMYRFYAEVAGARLIELAPQESPCSEPSRFALHWAEEDLIETARQCKVVFLASPNNPTGSVLRHETILRIAAEAPATAIVVDEAYIDFGGTSVLSDCLAAPNLVVLRTFSKAFGMAGLRVGLAFGNAELIALIRKAQSPYSVNAIAAEAARLAIGLRPEIDIYARQVVEARDAVCSLLSDLNIRHFESHANFVLFVPNRDPQALLSAAREAGVLLRDRHHDLPGAVRITLGPLSTLGTHFDLLVNHA